MKERIGEAEQVAAHRIEMPVREPVQHCRDPNDGEPDEQGGRWPPRHAVIGMSRIAGDVSVDGLADSRAARPTTRVAMRVSQNTTGYMTGGVTPTNGHAVTSGIASAHQRPADRR